MLQPMTEKEERAIVKNVVNTIIGNDIEILTKKAYNFVMLSSGFIAHYSHAGFKDYYKFVPDLERDILAFQPQNQWANFRQGENDYEYYMQKKKIYNTICDGIKIGIQVI